MKPPFPREGIVFATDLAAWRQDHYSSGIYIMQGVIETESTSQSTLSSPSEQETAKRQHRKVAIIQREIPHYRVAFFSAVQEAAQRSGLRVTVYSGDGGDRADHFPFKHQRLPIIRFGTGSSAPCWLSGLTEAIADADILVVPQELQCLNVLNLWLRRHSLGKVWIWWGHGYNYQTSTHRSWSQKIVELVKQFVTPRSNGLITYTQRGAEYWQRQGMPIHQVSSYFNTLDIEGLIKSQCQMPPCLIEEVKEKLGLQGKKVLLFSGRLYPQKEVDFLLRAFSLILKGSPDTTLLILGDGDERSKLERLCKELKLYDVHFLGEITDPAASSVYFTLADLLVIPGLVGLAIVHGFAFGLPLATTERDCHGPEIEYLTHENGLITPHNENMYATAIVRVLSSPPGLARMKLKCRVMANELTLVKSANRFVNAIVHFATDRTALPTTTWK